MFDVVNISEWNIIVCKRPYTKNNKNYLSEKMLVLLRKQDIGSVEITSIE